MKKHDQAGKVEVIGGEDNFVVEIERKIECQVDDDEKEEEEGGEFGFSLFAVFAVTMNHVVFCFYEYIVIDNSHIQHQTKLTKRKKLLVGRCACVHDMAQQHAHHLCPPSLSSSSSSLLLSSN